MLMIIGKRVNSNRSRSNALCSDVNVVGIAVFVVVKVVCR